MSEFKLSKTETIKFIEMYKKNECLWNLNNKVYKRQDLKQKAWEELAEEFKTTIEFVKKKIKFLRTSFSAEKKKVDASKKSGSGGDIHIPTLFYYNDLSFIRATMVMRGSMENVSSESNIQRAVDDPTDINSGVEYSKKPKVRPSDANMCAKKSKRGKYDRALEEIIAMNKEAPVSSDMYSSFGKSVEMQLRQLPMVEGTRLMSQIQMLISESISAHFLSRSIELNDSQLSSTPDEYLNDSSDLLIEYLSPSPPQDVIEVDD